MKAEVERKTTQIKIKEKGKDDRRGPLVKDAAASQRLWARVPMNPALVRISELIL
jgi:hypothetical protein